MSPAKTLMLFGALLFAAGAAWWLMGRAGGPGHGWSWLGRLPGDIRINRPNFHFYFPITTCLLASLVITVLLWLFRK